MCQTDRKPWIRPGSIGAILASPNPLPPDRRSTRAARIRRDYLVPAHERAIVVAGADVAPSWELLSAASTTARRSARFTCLSTFKVAKRPTLSMAPATPGTMGGRAGRPPTPRPRARSSHRPPGGSTAAPNRLDSRPSPSRSSATALSAARTTSPGAEAVAKVGETSHGCPPVMGERPSAPRGVPEIHCTVGPGD